MTPPLTRRRLRSRGLTTLMASATIAGATLLLSRNSPTATASTESAAAREDVVAALASLDALIAKGATLPWSIADAAAPEQATIFDRWTHNLDARARERVRATINLAETRARERLGLRLPRRSLGWEPRRQWQRLSPAAPAPKRIVLLVHGLDEPGEIWNDLAPLLRSKGYRVARLDYPNDQAINKSADCLAAALRALRAAGTEEVDLVCHSMGGLVARDVLTRADYYNGGADAHSGLPDVRRVVLVGTPNKGAPLAPLRLALEVREQFTRWFDDGALVDSLTGFFGEGAGDAGRDLAPGSDFLADRNARPQPRGVPFTLVVGVASPIGESDVLSMLDTPLARLVLAEKDAAFIAREARDLFGAVGDGVVPVSSALLEGVDDVVEISANHRSLLRTTAIGDAAKHAQGLDPANPGAVDVILNRLERTADQPAGGT